MLQTEFRRGPDQVVMLTPAAVSFFTDAFTAFDRDNDGILSLEEQGTHAALALSRQGYVVTRSLTTNRVCNPD